MEEQPIIQNLFMQFLSLPGTGLLVRSKLRSLRNTDGQAEKENQNKNFDLTVASSSSSMDSLRIPSRNNLRTPLNVPRSPTSSRASSRRSSPDFKGMRRGSKIKQFYFPEGPPISPQTNRRDTITMKSFFKNHDDGGLTEEDFFSITTSFCGMSSYCNAVLFNRIDEKKTGRVTMAMFHDYYTAHLQKFDTATRLFRLLNSTEKDGRRFLTRDSFSPLVDEVGDRHPGLQFLKSHPEFQARYSQTVKARIFYKVNKMANEQLSLRELKRSNFCQVLSLLDEEDDINKIHDYFSYEHFYVIYCKYKPADCSCRRERPVTMIFVVSLLVIVEVVFWELDEDHDFEIDIKDLMRYDDFALTTKVIQRVMEGCGRPFVSQTPGRMGYEDFVVFLMSEVDKTSDIRILTIVFTRIIPFFGENKGLSRAVFGHLKDKIKQKGKGVWGVESKFTKRDIRNTKMATQFFNIIFNLTKHVLAEQRDPILIHQVHSTPELCDWDRYAINEYIKLAESEIQDNEALDQSEDLDWEEEKDIDMAGDIDDEAP
eukprot:jgi/Bigna1/77802/fgenesh1_pg.50_\